jgi:RimJ/RimL family protein N-acetyltransferase
MLTKPLIAFTTARFHCRDFVPEDSSNAIDLRLFGDAEEFEQILQWQASRPRVNFQLAILDSNTKQLIGTAGVLMEGTNGGDATLDLNLAQNSRGRYAVAFEIGYSLINWAFDALSLTQLTVFISSDQITVKKLAQYAKFSRVDKESETNTEKWRLSYGTWAEHAEQLWKNHGTQSH